jgi:N4-gp56 family major capsid protein
MAYTTVASANQVSQWDEKFFEEYVRANQFSSYFGTDENAVIQVKENLTKSAGDKITISLIKALAGSGVTGSTTLEGNEESLSNYGHQITINALRNAVRLDKMEELRTVMDLRNAAKSALKTWAMAKLRDEIIKVLQSTKVDGKTAYASCTAGERNAYIVANSDRILFGASTANMTSAGGVWLTGIQTLDTAADLCTPASVSTAKRMAQVATNGRIRPITIDGQGEWYVYFADYRCFRDFKASGATSYYWQQGMERGKDNPLFTDGDLMYDGIIVKQIPEIPTIGAIGAASCQVGSNFLCGAQAIALAWGQRTKSIVEEFDYGFQYGCAIEEIRGVERITMNGIQHGVLTHYCATTSD